MMSVGMSGLIIFIPVIAYCITSIVLFIVDNVNARREGRRVKVVFKVLFIVAMALIGIAVILVALLYGLTLLIVMNM